MEMRPVTPDASGQPGGLGPADGSGPARVAPLPLRSRPVGARGDDLGVVGGRDRLHGGRRRIASDRAEPARRLPGPAVDRHELHADHGLADPASRFARATAGDGGGCSWSACPFTIARLRLSRARSGEIARLEPLPFRWNRNGAPNSCFDAFSSRELVATSLENALGMVGLPTGLCGSRQRKLFKSAQPAPSPD